MSCRCCKGPGRHSNEQCCHGWFVNQETGEIERCDECALFTSDEAVHEYLKRSSYPSAIAFAKKMRGMQRKGR